MTVGRGASVVQPTSPAHAAPPVKRNKKNANSSQHRAEIQGLRAVLMAQVLLFHAWTIGSPIGIDSFILISAYLMTSSFVRRSEHGHMPFFMERWANTFKRLLPPLVVTVVVTLFASMIVLPMTRWREIVIQSFASLTYWENWRLVDVAADYYANDHAVSSPLQHLWSMSMQGQIFLIWPVLMTLCVLLAKLFKADLRISVFVAFGLVTVASLVWLLKFAPHDGSIYFDTRSRVWEFAFGSAVAAAGPWIKLPKSVARVLSGIALAVLLVFCLVRIGEYPGPMAFFPIIAVSTILVLAPLAGDGATNRILSIRPLTWLGDISYSVYLVHWPMFVLFLANEGKANLDLGEGVLLIALSISLAYVLSRRVDEPLRHWKWSNKNPWRKGLVILVSLILGLIPVGAVWMKLERIDAQEAAEMEAAEQAFLQDLIPASGPGSDEHPGARAISEGLLDKQYDEDPIPGPLTDPKWGYLGKECREGSAKSIPLGDSGSCSSFGDLETAEKTVFVGGNSHAQQDLTPMVNLLLKKHDWAGDAVFRRCMWTDPTELEGDCVEIVESMNDYVREIHPDYVFLMATRTTADSDEEYVVPGVQNLIKDLTDQGIEVFGMRDNPRSNTNLYDCAVALETGGTEEAELVDSPESSSTDGIQSSSEGSESNSGSAQSEMAGERQLSLPSEPVPVGPDRDCAMNQRDVMGKDSLLDELKDIPGFHLIDMTDALCIDGTCPAVIGNIYVYIDSNHLSIDYTRTMAGMFIERVEEVLAGLPPEPQSVG